MTSMLILISAACMAVGLCIGWCGVAGFLLPILFVSRCGFDSAQSLFLSFSCFLVSGLIGARNYRKRGELSLAFSKPLIIGSILGAALGAVIGRIYVTQYIKVVLYLVVLLSGLMIFVQDLLTRGKRSERTISAPVLLAVGFVTAVICAMSGAGGPVIVMPLLVVLGLPIRSAVGTALFDSVFIAIPSILVYGSQADISAILPYLAAALLSHAVGIYIGSLSAGRIPQRPLKLGVAAFSVLFALRQLILMI